LVQRALLLPGAAPQVSFRLCLSPVLAPVQLCAQYYTGRLFAISRFTNLTVLCPLFLRY
jgi:hypothetical protein